MEINFTHDELRWLYEQLQRHVRDCNVYHPDNPELGAMYHDVYIPDEDIIRSVHKKLKEKLGEKDRSIRAMEWINVNDRLPPEYEWVLVIANNKGTDEPKPISIARIQISHNEKKWKFCNKAPVMPNYGAWLDIEYPMDDDDITHWMPLPKPPKKDDSDGMDKL